MAKGRKPLPTAIKALRGNPGKRPLSEREPQPAKKRPRCPAHLSAAAKKEWRRLAPLLETSGLLTSIDGAALEMYCETYARWLDAMANVAKYGAVINTSKDKEKPYLQKSPYLAIVEQCQKEMRGWLTEFGMTPSSRSSIKLPAQETTDELDEFLKNPTLKIAN